MNTQSFEQVFSTGDVVLSGGGLAQMEISGIGDEGFHFKGLHSEHKLPIYIAI